MNEWFSDGRSGLPHPNPSSDSQVPFHMRSPHRGTQGCFKTAVEGLSLSWDSNTVIIYEKSPELNICRRTVVYNLITWKYKLWDSFEKQAGSRWWNTFLALPTWLPDYGFIGFITCGTAEAVMGPPWDPGVSVWLPGVGDWQTAEIINKSAISPVQLTSTATLKCVAFSVISILVASVANLI